MVCEYSESDNAFLRYGHLKLTDTAALILYIFYVKARLWIKLDVLRMGFYRAMLCVVRL